MTTDPSSARTCGKHNNRAKNFIAKYIREPAGVEMRCISPSTFLKKCQNKFMVFLTVLLFIYIIFYTYYKIDIAS